MITVRKYHKKDSIAVGRLIADTFRQFNLDFASPEDQEKLLGPFRYSRSRNDSHRKAIADLISAPMVFVAVSDKEEIVGVLRGCDKKMRSLFVHKKFHRKGVGQMLVRRFERECVSRGAGVIRLAATIFAVPFYLKMGYKKSTGVRAMDCFDGTGLKYQPMKKIL